MPPRIRPGKQLTVPTPSIYTHCPSCLVRTFSSTAPFRAEGRERWYTPRQNAMHKWLMDVGQNFKEPPQGPNYLSAYDLRTGKQLGAQRLDRRPSEGRARRGRTPSREEDEDEEAEENEEVLDQELNSGDSQRLDAAAVDESKPKREDGNDNEMRPFPLNPHFQSQSILSEDLRMEVWRRVQNEKNSVRQVSVELGIDMRRVGAVVRLVEVERRMRAENQALALPYAKVIHSMVPQTPYRGPNDITPHESINDLPVHPLTGTQLFYPTSESRAFNRTDAGRVFSAAPRLPDSQDIGQGGNPARQPWEDQETEIIGKPLHMTGKKSQRFIRGSGQHYKTPGIGEYEVLKPADARIPHPHLIAYEQDKRDPHFCLNRSEVESRYEERLKAEAEKSQLAVQKRKMKDEAKKERINTDRWQWVVTDVKAGDGVGERYGVPSQERKRGLIKIPRKVEV